jgi:phosphoglycerate dehydrogenase-like enzyme
MANAAIDLGAATELGVLVCGTESWASRSTPELAWGLILALTRHIVREDGATRRGEWQLSIGPELQGLTLGLLGLGRIGGQMALLGRAFQMRVIAWSQNLTEGRCAELGVTHVEKDALFSQADIVSIHLRLSQRTRGLVGARELALMKPTSYLINTSRGPIVDEAALISALRRQAIGGAGLDVFDQEPLPLDHPLRTLPNTVITPHIGYVSTQAYEAHYRDTVENITAYLAGRHVRAMNPEVLASPALRQRPQTDSGR